MTAQTEQTQFRHVLQKFASYIVVAFCGAQLASSVLSTGCQAV